MEGFNEVTQAEEIEGLIPQKPPIVMVDKLLFNNEKRTVSALLVKTENIFCKDGFLKEPGIIENIAQTAALGVGYHYKMVKKSRPPVGFIGAIKNLYIHTYPRLGMELITEVIADAEVFGATLITGKVRCGDEEIGGCEMKVFLMENINS